MGPPLNDLLILLLAGAAGAMVGGMAVGRPAPAGARRAGRENASLERALVVFSVDGLDTLRTEHGDAAALRLQERIAGILRRAAPPGARFEHRTRTGTYLLTVPDIPFAAVGGLAESARRLATFSTVESDGRYVGRTVSAAVVPMHQDTEAALAEAMVLLARGRRHGGDVLVTADDDGGAVETADVLAALRAGALDYHMQPIHDLTERRIVGFEALIRWTVDGRTVMTPNQFLHRLDWLPDDAVDRIADLAVAAATPFVSHPDPLWTAFNVTADALERPDGPAGRWLSAIVDRLPPDRLTLELLETAVFARSNATMEGLRAIRAKGVTLALDDFGTGLSNFDRLLAFRPDLVKIDRAFVTAPSDGAGPSTTAAREAVVEALVRLSGRLDMALVAEGLEDEADVAAVRRLGIRYGQGYHLGRPEPAATWAARLG